MKASKTSASNNGVKGGRCLGDHISPIGGQGSRGGRLPGTCNYSPTKVDSPK